MTPVDPDDVVPASGARRALGASGSFKYFYGPMDCGKSTLALQMSYNTLFSKIASVTCGNMSKPDLPVSTHPSWLGSRPAEIGSLREVHAHASIQSLGTPLCKPKADRSALKIGTDLRQLRNQFMNGTVAGNLRPLLDGHLQPLAGLSS